MQDRLVYLESVTEYLYYENSRLAKLLRHAIAPIAADLPHAKQVRDSFDYQWDRLPTGRYNLENEEFRKEACGYVLEFTGLPGDWFKGKNVIDVGCGAGRYSWALSVLGANVLSVDQSEHGLKKNTRRLQ